MLYLPILAPKFGRKYGVKNAKGGGEVQGRNITEIGIFTMVMKWKLRGGGEGAPCATYLSTEEFVYKPISGVFPLYLLTFAFGTIFPTKFWHQIR